MANTMTTSVSASIMQPCRRRDRTAEYRVCQPFWASWLPQNTLHSQGSAPSPDCTGWWTLLAKLPEQTPVPMLAEGGTTFPLLFDDPASPGGHDSGLLWALLAGGVMRRPGFLDVINRFFGRQKRTFYYKAVHGDPVCVLADCAA